MKSTKRVAEATTPCVNDKENTMPLISESSPLNQRDMNQNSMDGKNGIPPIMENIITFELINYLCVLKITFELNRRNFGDLTQKLSSRHTNS